MLIFVFLPLLGLIMAFQRFSPYSGSGPFGAFIHSEFVGFDIFRGLFNGPDFWRVLRNTLAINISALIFYFPAPIILALLLHEIQNQAFKRTTQTIVYIPHFISWVIVGSITFQMFNAQDGILMMLIKQVFPTMPNVLSTPGAFIPMLLGQSMWKETGFGTIIYLAALASVDPQLYEAATVDGANRWQKMWNITLPGIVGTIVIMLILKLGQMLNTGYEQIFLMQNSLNRSVSDVFDTFYDSRQAP
jgi:putative aldouronate transport system permease protein